MDFLSKVVLVVSILFMGYNLSEMFSTYQSENEKIDELKNMIRFTESSPKTLRISNIFMIISLSVIYTVLIWYAGFAFWVVLLLALKLLLTILISDYMLISSLKLEKLSYSVYRFSKVDYFFNALSGCLIAFLLVL